MSAGTRIKHFGKTIIVHLFWYPRFFFYQLRGYYVLTGFGHLGDNVIQLSCVEEFKDLIQKKIVVFGGRPLMALKHFYPAIDKWVYIRDTFYDFRKMPAIYGKRGKNFRNIFQGNVHQFIIAKARNIFQLSETPLKPITLPTVPQSDISSVPPKSVLIIPNSYSFINEQITEHIYQRASALLAQGYKVFVNAKNENKHHGNEGFEYVFWDLQTLYNSAKKMEFIVAMRCGLLDFLIGTGTPMEIHYGDDGASTYLMKYYDLNLWKTGTKITSIHI